MWGVLPSRTLHYLYPFSPEQEISDAQAEELKAALEARAWWLITEYLAKSEHSEHQCRAYLKKHSFHPSIADKCIALCKAKGYLDDHRFAEIYIRSMLERGKSRRAIIQKLSEHRIPPEALSALFEEQEEPQQSLDLLKEQISRLLWKHRAQEPRKAKEKVYASLYRKGFTLEDIGEAWRELQRDD